MTLNYNTFTVISVNSGSNISRFRVCLCMSNAILTADGIAQVVQATKHSQRILPD